MWYRFEISPQILLVDLHAAAKAIGAFEDRARYSDLVVSDKGRIVGLAIVGEIDAGVADPGLHLAKTLECRLVDLQDLGQSETVHARARGTPAARIRRIHEVGSRSTIPCDDRYGSARHFSEAGRASISLVSADT